MSECNPVVINWAGRATQAGLSFLIVNLCVPWTLPINQSSRRIVVNVCCFSSLKGNCHTQQKYRISFPLIKSKAGPDPNFLKRITVRIQSKFNKIRRSPDPVQSKSSQCSSLVGVTFSDSDAAPVPKCFNLDPVRVQNFFNLENPAAIDPTVNLPMFSLKKWSGGLLLLPKWKSDSASGFSQIFDSGSYSKTQNPLESGTPDPWPLLLRVSGKLAIWTLISLGFYDDLVLHWSVF